MAFGKIGISVDSATGQVRMHFLTCSATLPDTPGLHVVPTACGSGKSTDIAEIAVEKKSGGVLIIVPTKKEADEMGARIGRLGGVSMPDIEVLHCQNPAIGKYRSDPWFLSKKPILVLTSVRPQIDPLILFLSYNGGIRELVLIDELINFFPESFKVPEGLYETLTFVDKNKTHGGRKAIETIVIGSTTFYRHIYQDKDEMEAAFSLAGKNIRKLLPGHSELDKVKRSVIFEHVRDHGFSEIQQKVLDMAKVTNVCLFDGSADLLFPKSDPRLVPVSGDKYSSDIQFHQFPFRMKRKQLEDCQESDVLRLAPEFIDLVRVKSQTEKVLVICWKTVGPRKISTPTDKASEYEGLEDTAVSFPGILRRALVSAGGRDENIFITYRGSGQDRGSNEYKDTSAVVFLGEWRLPEEPITGQISEAFGLKMSFWSYKKSLLVQTICRSRIRQHQGLPIEVYFSEDINYQMAWEVQEYFKANSAPGKKIGGLLKPCRILSKPDKGTLYDITCLYSYDSRIRSSIESGTSYSFSIPHDTLFKLIPWRSPRVSRFSGLIALLDTYNITMTIT